MDVKSGYEVMKSLRKDVIMVPDGDDYVMNPKYDSGATLNMSNGTVRLPPAVAGRKATIIARGGVVSIRSCNLDRIFVPEKGEYFNSSYMLLTIVDDEEFEDGATFTIVLICNRRGYWDIESMTGVWDIPDVEGKVVVLGAGNLARKLPHILYGDSDINLYIRITGSELVTEGEYRINNKDNYTLGGELEDWDIDKLEVIDNDIFLDLKKEGESMGVQTPLTTGVATITIAKECFENEPDEDMELEVLVEGFTIEGLENLTEGNQVITFTVNYINNEIGVLGSFGIRFAGGLIELNSNLQITEESATKFTVTSVDQIIITAGPASVRLDHSAFKYPLLNNSSFYSYDTEVT